MKIPVHNVTISLADEDVDNLREYARANKSSASRIIRGWIRTHTKPIIWPNDDIAPTNPPPETRRMRFDGDNIWVIERIMRYADVDFATAVNFLIRRGTQNS